MEEFIPALIEQTIDEVEYQLLEKPTRIGGIGIRDSIEASKHAFNTYVKLFLTLERRLRKKSMDQLQN